MTTLITGSTVGIGLETAMQLARQGKNRAAWAQREKAQHDGCG